MALAELEGRIRQRVDTALGEMAAERQYSFDAKKRLYTAIGPLRFQLLLACRDLAGRIQRRLTSDYDMSMTGYFGQSTVFRILRPICLAELVERQIAYADFSVDSGAIDLLRFKKAAFAVFSGGSLVEGHPQVDWTDQVQHVFFDHLSRCANAIIVREDDSQERAMRFHEFEIMMRDPSAMTILAPFPKILKHFDLEQKPLFWVRLVAYGNLCNDFINRTGATIGFQERDYPVQELLLATKDGAICQRIGEYVKRCEDVLQSPL